MEYYYLDYGKQRQGPVAKSELRIKGVTSNTLVWRNGMSDWQAAGMLDELKDLFGEGAPPPLPNQGTYPPPNPIPIEQKPDNLLVWSILSTVLCCLPLGVVAIINSSKVDSLWNSGDKEGAIKAAKNAKLFSLIALGCGVVGGIIYTIIMGLSLAL